MAEDAKPTAPSAPGKKRLWLALLAVLLLVLAILPSVAAGPARGFAVDYFNATYAGSLELERLRLGWLSSQGIERALLRDPDEALVATASVRAPSLAKLLLSGLSGLGRIEVALEADLVERDDGQLNVLRALAPRTPPSGAEGPPASGPPAPEEQPVDLDALRSLEVEVAVTVARATWSDARTRAAGTPIELRDLTLDLRLAPGEPIALAALGKLVSNGEGDLRVEAAIDGLGREAVPALTLDFAVRSLPCALIDVLAGLDGMLVDVLGPRLDLTALVERGSGPSLVVNAWSERAELELRGELEGGDLVLAPDTGLRASLAWTPALEQRFLASADGGPPPARRVSSDERIRVSGGALALAWLELAKDARRPGFPAGSPALAAARASVRVDAGAWLVLESGAGDAKPSAGVRCEDVTLLASLRPTGESPRSQVVVLTHLAERPSEPIRAEIDGPGLELLVAYSPDDPASSGIDLVARAPAVTTALLDALSGTGTLLTDVLGPRIELDATIERLSAHDGRLRAEVRSGLATVDLRGRLEQWVTLRPLSEGDGASEVRFALTPASSNGLVGKLVPFLVELQSAVPGERARLSLRDFTLPLDGDLKRLDATLDLALGEVSYQFLPGLQKLLDKKARSARLEPYGLRVNGGVVAYRSVPVRIGEAQVFFDGSFDIAAMTFDLRTEVPGEALGEKGQELLGKAAKLLGGSARIPLVISGSPLAPKVSLGAGFKESLGGLLDSGVKAALPGLLERLLEKD